MCVMEYRMAGLSQQSSTVHLWDVVDSDGELDQHWQPDRVGFKLGESSGGQDCGDPARVLVIQGLGWPARSGSGSPLRVRKGLVSTGKPTRAVYCQNCVLPGPGQCIFQARVRQCITRSILVPPLHYPVNVLDQVIYHSAICHTS